MDGLETASPFSLADWIIIIVYMVGITFAGVICKKYIKGVADFIVAGRGMRKWLGISAGNAADTGLISIMYLAEEAFRNGLASFWLMVNHFFCGLLIGKTGFVVSRFRATGAMTIPQFYEMKYGRKVRILGAVIMAFAGIVNMGLFPIVGAKFITYFCGFPENIELLGMQISTVNLILGVMISSVLITTVSGGMVAVILTDYLQFVILAIAVTTTTLFVFKEHSWQSMIGVVDERLEDAGFNPFAAGHSNYGLGWVLWMFLLGLLSGIVWAPNMLRVSSAKDPKTARQMFFLNAFMGPGRCMMFLIWGLGGLVMIVTLAQSNPDIDISEYSIIAVPILLNHITPPILSGLLFAGILSCFMSTHDAYFMAWSAVITQDIILPLKKKPMTPIRQVWLTRIVILLIGVFLYFWGVYYHPPASLWQYMAITGSMYISGAAALVVGGFYWKKSNTLGAYAALIVGMTLPLANLVGQLIWKEYYPITDIQAGLGAFILAGIVMIAGSMIDPRKPRELVYKYKDK